MRRFLFCFALLFGGDAAVASPPLGPTLQTKQAGTLVVPNTKILNFVSGCTVAQSGTTAGVTCTGAASGTVTSITCAAGLSCSTNPITATGTITLPIGNRYLAPQSYTFSGSPSAAQNVDTPTDLRITRYEIWTTAFDTTAGIGAASSFASKQRLLVRRNGATLVEVQKANEWTLSEIGASAPTLAVSGTNVTMVFTRGNSNTTNWYVEFRITEMS